jgi:hypothetical protein
MKTNKYVTVFALLNALIFCLGGAAAHAGPGQKGSTHRGGQADSHISEKGATNSNAKWSADPLRGWVRAEERHQLHGDKSSTTQSKGKRGNHKGGNSNGKK